jgi:hypothetical protein
MGYVEAPALSAYAAELLPVEKRLYVTAVATCYKSHYPNIGWFATVETDEGVIYHYKLHMFSSTVSEERTPELFFSTTPAQRKAMTDDERPWYQGCFGRQPSYLLRTKDGVTAFVDKKVVVNEAFDDGVKLRVRHLAQAVELTSAASKKHVPVETTWGVKP